VYRTGQIVNVPIGPGTLGRVLDALGQPIDGKGPLANVRSSLVEVKAPGIVARQSVREPLYTGEAPGAGVGAGRAVGCRPAGAEEQGCMGVGCPDNGVQGCRQRHEARPSPSPTPPHPTPPAPPQA
jgi:hypothetical protein